MADVPLLPLSFGSFITLWHCCSSLSPRARLAGAVGATVARFAASTSLAAEFARILLSETLFVTLLVFGNGFIDLLADSGRHYVRDLQHAYKKSLFADLMRVSPVTRREITKPLLIHKRCEPRADAALH